MSTTPFEVIESCCREGRVKIVQQENGVLDVSLYCPCGAMTDKTVEIEDGKIFWIRCRCGVALACQLPAQPKDERSSDE